MSPSVCGLSASALSIVAAHGQYSVMNSPSAYAVKWFLRSQHPLLRRLHHPRQISLLEPLLEKTAILPGLTSAIHSTVGGREVVTVHNHRLNRHRDRVLVYIHGGGYNTGNPRTHRALAARLMLAGKFDRVMLPSYRRAPQHPFPAGREDIWSFWQALLQTHDASQLYLAGESAGGGLCLGLSQQLRDQGMPQPVRLYLHSPWLDLSLSGHSYRDPALYDGFTGRHRHRAQWIHRVFARHYIGGHPAANPEVSPVFASMDRLPPMLVHTGSDEVFLDDSRLLATRCAEAGTPCELIVWDGMWHAFAMFAPLVPEATRALRLAGRWLETGHV